ncbi:MULTISPECIES: hypothetical protein [Glycomyces]|uniref:Uncharacterized protein n=2 Tax=Glycomyces TaxID=58113 RepID=A0A9X3PK01_9ACTN|nr:hypothetical protein [Glycomyces lechevalierae]MDA1386814.1 hypothetical protein [Glycomyces lechevalierae]MDR7340195.1 hypothetical protein [Glycomyces lechevalierae]
MNKGFRVLLQVFQVLFILGALLFMTFSFLMAYVDFGATEGEQRFVDTWILGFALLSIATSPALWSLVRRGGQAAPASTGSFDRVQGSTVQPQPQPQQQPGGVFEPMNASAAPAPPASSYGQPSAGGMAPSSSPQAGTSPWGSGR